MRRQTAEWALLLQIIASVVMCGSNYASCFGLEWITQMEIITVELSKSDGEGAFNGDDVC